MLPKRGAGKQDPSLVHKPQRAPRPNMKFFIPEQPVLRQTSVTTVTTVQKRVFIIVSLKCIASVFRHLDDGLHKSTTLFALCKRNVAIFEQQFDDRTPHIGFFDRDPIGIN
ncbi:hypothetical protein [Rubripirellula obstinata]|uniref:hypothetical protein n=1 Tax=Rubripirellula obstinata TaxID=406547 RepID=UPI00122C16BA|nr:hypothetical protein [Rubripirellula obstinata]